MASAVHERDGAEFFNAGNRPTPPATLEFRYTSTGAPFGSPLTVESHAPGTGTNAGVTCGDMAELDGMLTFDQPVAGQAIPSPLCATVEVQDANGHVAVDPAR